MAKFTINVMGLEQEKRIMDVIMQSVSREGKYELPVSNNVQPQDLMANKLVGYKVLTRNLVRIIREQVMSMNIMQVNILHKQILKVLTNL